MNRDSDNLHATVNIDVLLNDDFLSWRKSNIFIFGIMK